MGASVFPGFLSFPFVSSFLLSFLSLAAEMAAGEERRSAMETRCFMVVVGDGTETCL